GDNSNPLAGDQAALARVLRMNGCTGSATAPWHSETTVLAGVCQQYTGCPPEYPVVFCTTAGDGHSSQAERAIPASTLFFDQVAAAASP
ncbi:MAG TPA: hypothetical protein VK989_05655, partial [Polyangia bacterium]|nr:hypothetical protein [Polyangia bacterium]